MDVKLRSITVRELVESYKDDAEDGVSSYGGKLDIRPPYQREFIYNIIQQRAVIDTVRKGFPLNIMYWSDNGQDTYEVIDGQQRTLSICEYVANNFTHKGMNFHALTNDQQEDILNYELDVYVCTGTESAKLDWFRTINIAGEKLTEQELRNAVYSGPWLTDAKRHFSRTGCPAYQIGKDYVRGTPNRQDYLETVIKWHKDYGESIEVYMSRYQPQTHATDIWIYYQNVINWVKNTFTEVRSEMKGQNWGKLYDDYHTTSYNPVELEERVKALMRDQDIKKKRGIYEYVFDGDERHLNIRAFDGRQRREAYEDQSGICPMCNEHFEIKEMEADHITPWSKGGKTEKGNCQMLCKDDNRRKGAI